MSELERNFKENGGYFEKINLEKIFIVKGNPQLNKDSFEFDENWEYPYFTRTVLNNWIAWYVKYLDEEHKIKWNSLAIWMLWMQFFYMEKDFYAGQFTKTIFPKFEKFNSTLAQYFIVLLNKNSSIYQGSLVRDFEKLFYETEIILPLDKNWNIAFEYMENYIRFLEAERIEELEAYLLATWLKDYNLTEREKSALDKFVGGGKIYKKYLLKDIFEIVWTKSLDSNAIDFIDSWINFVWRTFENNWIQGKISKREFEPNKPFTITATVIWNYKYVKFQREEYYCSQNINKLTPNEKIFSWNKNIAYYFVALVQKFVSLYDWQQWWYKLDDIKNFEIFLPTLWENIDFEFMEDFIKATQKLVIKDLVIWNEKKLEAYKKIVFK